MSPELERLIELCASLYEAPSNEYSRRLQALRQTCEPHAARLGGDTGRILEFVKSAYLRKLAAENKRAGRPPGKR
jgi:hypothetical protein